MLEIVNCRNCGESRIKIGQTTCSLHFELSVFCNACYNSHSRKLHIFFCNLQCMQSYLAHHPNSLEEYVVAFEEKRQWQTDAPIKNSSIESSGPE